MMMIYFDHLRRRVMVHFLKGRASTTSTSYEPRTLHSPLCFYLRLADGEEKWGSSTVYRVDVLVWSASHSC